LDKLSFDMLGYIFISPYNAIHSAPYVYDKFGVGHPAHEPVVSLSQF